MCTKQPQDRFETALRMIDEENAKDPNRISTGTEISPRELVYSQWLTRWIERLTPNASEHLRLAARCQHICRWMIPRNAYPMDRTGYLKWRTELKKFHAAKAGEILKRAGYSEADVARVQKLNLKEDLAHDPEAQILEDALCLVFLEHQLSDLAAKTEEAKVISALQKSWKKMSPRGREAALNLNYSTGERALLDKALQT